VARTDLTREELINYRPTVAEPADFDAFWDETIEETRSFDLDLHVQPVKTPYRTIEIQDASFRGFAGDRINAWLVSPRQDPGPRPAVVEYFGYNGGRDVPGRLHPAGRRHPADKVPHGRRGRHSGPAWVRTARARLCDDGHRGPKVLLLPSGICRCAARGGGRAQPPRRRCAAPASFSVALMDQVCPPSTVYAAYHAYGGSSKDIIVYPFNDHEGGLGHQRLAQITWLNRLIGVEDA
jgi:cephalosporin-C deacetylase-like acetyl esterase